ncbi:MAG TPA: DUF6259 domain-containing protein [Bryobacteraceae bacterium]
MSTNSNSENPTRRTLLKQVAGTAMAIALPQVAISAPASEVALENSHFRVTFDSATGALTGLERKASGWKIHRRPELGASFRMLAPLPTRRDNFILGHRQHAVRVEKTGNRVHLEWNNLLSEHGGVLPIRFMATVTLDGDALKFESSLENNSSLVVETAEYPCLGDFSAPAPDAPLWRREMWYGNLQSQEIYPHFKNNEGYWGVDFPVKTGNSNRSLFSLIQSADQGLYVQLNDHVARYLVQYMYEQKPGVLESIHNEVPREETTSGKTVHLEFRTTHFPFLAQKSSIDLTPIVLRTYSGDWQSGLDLYKQWRETWFRQIHVPNWAKDVHSWQQLQINDPEDSLCIRYSDLVKYGEECARNGVRAIQLVGWNRGGQDRGNPTQDIDPRLGTWQELHNAIARIQALGVKIVLFGKFNWADVTTSWYRRELYKFDDKDPYGEPYEHGGYAYLTPTQLAGINKRRFAVMCFQCAAYRDIAAKEFEKVAALQPAGFLYDEVCHHGPALYCFAADHGHPVPAFIYRGDIPMAKALDEVVKGSPDFLFSGEGPEDILLQYYPLSYFRINDGHPPVCRYIDSQAPLMVAVTGFDDREMLNRILMYRYIISYEPYNFKGHLSDFPLTLEYGKKIDALRSRYKDRLWDAAYRDKLGARVTAGGQPHDLYSVFRNANGKRAVVVVNESATEHLSAQVDVATPGKLVLVTPENPDPVPASGSIAVPPRSAAVVMET